MGGTLIHPFLSFPGVAGPPPVGGWDILNATYTGRFLLVDDTNLNSDTREALPEDVWFKPDGTELYIVGTSGDGLDRWALTTPWSLAAGNAVWQQFFALPELDGNSGLWINPEGTHVFVVSPTSAVSADPIVHYTMSPGWDWSTLAHVNTVTLGGIDTSPVDVAFKPDGTKMFVLGTTGNLVREVPLGVAWDTTTIQAYTNTIDFDTFVSPGEAGPMALMFNPDGTKLYVSGGGNDDIYVIDLPTAYSLSGATLGGTWTGAGISQLHGFHISPDGSKLYIIARDDKSIREFDVP